MAVKKAAKTAKARARRKSAPSFEAGLVDYLVREHFNGDSGEFARHTQYTKQQIEYWRSGSKKPQKSTLRWLLSTTIAPEFRVAAEFEPIEITSRNEISKIVRGALNGHEKNTGVYAFYDSMCNVIYVGKASKGFGQEMYQQLRAQLGIGFPKAVASAPSERWMAVKYVSAYEIPKVHHMDYPKHVESLVLRLSKPVGNKVLGTLKRSAPPKEG